MPDGTVNQLEQIKGAQPGDVSHGLFRVKKYPDVANSLAKTKGRSSFLMLRTISNNPDTSYHLSEKGKKDPNKLVNKGNSWVHPGFIGFRFFDQAMAWATSDNGLSNEFKRLLDEELKK